MTRIIELTNSITKRLAWTSEAINEKIAAGAANDLDTIQRKYAEILVSISSIDGWLCDLAIELGKPAWREELVKLRVEDELLFYMWKARDVIEHQALQFGVNSFKQVELKILDAEKTNQISKMGRNDLERSQYLFCFLYKVKTLDGLMSKMKNGKHPSPDRVALAGVQILFNTSTLSLPPIKVRMKGKSKEIPAPKTHLGKPLPSSSLEVSRKALEFYRSKFESLTEGEIK